MKDILIVLNGGDSENAVRQAFGTAKTGSKNVKVLQILDSELYHYGHHDLVAPRLNKQRFLLYIREQVLERGKIEADKLRDRAAQVGKNLEINLITYDEYLKYSKYFGVPEKEFEYHAIIMALVEGKYYYIEPQSDIYCKA